MRVLFAAAAMVGFVGSATAGSITLTFNNGGNLTKTITPADADVTRIITAYKPLCPQVTFGTPCTNTQTFDWLATGLFRGFRDATQHSEQDAVAKTAKDGIAPIAGVP